MSVAQQPLAMIAAISRDGIIGIDNDIPWHHPEDFRFFRRMTVGHTLIMGHSTFRSLGKPLPGREHSILSRNPSLVIDAPRCRVFSQLDDAISAARAHDPCPMIAGGAQIYALAMAQATLLYLTHIEADALSADTPKDAQVIRFPEVRWDEWERVEERIQGPLRFATYQRTKHAGERDNG